MTRLFAMIPKEVAPTAPKKSAYRFVETEYQWYDATAP